MNICLFYMHLILEYYQIARLRPTIDICCNFHLLLNLSHNLLNFLAVINVVFAEINQITIGGVCVFYMPFNVALL